MKLHTTSQLLNFIQPQSLINIDNYPGLHPIVNKIIPSVIWRVRVTGAIK